MGRRRAPLKPPLSCIDFSKLHIKSFYCDGFSLPITVPPLRNRRSPKSPVSGASSLKARPRANASSRVPKQTNPFRPKCMTTDAKECSENAKRCVALAAKATDPIVLRRLLETAQGWMRLAFDLSKLERDKLVLMLGG